PPHPQPVPREHAEVVGLLREAVQLPRDPLLRHQGRQDRPAVEGDDRAGRHRAHPAQRVQRREEPDQRIPARLQGRGHPAHRAVHRRHLRLGREDARGGRDLPRHAGHLFRGDRPARAGPRRGRAAVGQEQDPDRRRPGDQEEAAAADLHRERVRPDLLRDHPAQGQRGLRRRQLPGAVREHRARPDAPRGAVIHKPPPGGRGASKSDQAMAITSNGYQSGFGNEFASEAVPGTLPEGRNSPQKVAHGLYAEQVSGTAFTAPRHANRRSWLYRIRPAAMHGPFQPFEQSRLHNDFGTGPVTPDQLRWSPLPLPEVPVDFVDGLVTMAGNGSPASQSGIGIHMYAANRDMQGRFFYDADGELLIVPQQGRLHIETELGVLDVEPQEIAVVPRGIRFRVVLPDGPSRGYVCENFGAFLRIPDLGPIGSNGLANPRDFLAPNAAYEDVGGDFELIAKFQGHPWRASIGHSPLDVVGWHGNHAPYKYDLRTFNTIGSISYDHPDPSIFLVLTSP